MIISDRHRFIFLHIPKCGGTTVRTALMPYDDHRAEFYDRGRSTHETLGEVDYHHLPLNVLRTHFPHAYELLETYPSYALTRDPMERFCSGVVYRFHQIKGNPKDDITTEVFQKEAAEIIGLLEDATGKEKLPADLIHFTPQSDYIYLNGERIVHNVYKLEHLDQMLAVLSEMVGKPIEWERSGEALKYKHSTAAKIDAYLQPKIKKFLPRRVWKPIFSRMKSSFMSHGLISRGETSFLQETLNKSQRAYVRRYYEEDDVLYATSI